MVELSRLIEHVKTKSDLSEQNATPLYLRIERGIESAIMQGLVAVNDALPAERELAAALGVSRVTVRNSVRVLVDKGILVQRHGAGTFVAARVERAPNQIMGFSEDMHIRGLTTRAIWLDRSRGTPTPEECEALEIMPDSIVSRLYRLRLADEKPMCLEHAVLPESILPDPTLIDRSLYSWLQGHDRRPTRCLQTVSARLLDVSHAHLLGVPTGSACLYVERKSYLCQTGLTKAAEQREETETQIPKRSNSDRPVEFVRSFFRGDLYEYVSEINI
ncbi:GntR family transcriptional regulator [uncultured Cohaesibacter sp.]|uniref:GntR family transcriptional regulator n=1 Tax=uncultured Cohaesibacter sp. TaxID=1002546 RepID=UPI00292F8E3B|nr:GntR family transcriptional regulator [uncultured Cohaesibacter sp.]